MSEGEAESWADLITDFFFFKINFREGEDCPRERVLRLNFEVVVQESKKGYLTGLNKNIALEELRFHMKL